MKKQICYYCENETKKSTFLKKNKIFKIFYKNKIKIKKCTFFNYINN